MGFIQTISENWPELENTLLVGAFSGWNDAAAGATTTIRLLSEKSQVEAFASIDPEEFYMFSDTRPEISITKEGLRELTWPTIEFSAAKYVPGINRSLVTVTGIEPDLKWRTFTDTFIEICKRCNVTEVILLGAMVATVPHTRPVPLSGWSTIPERQVLLEQLGVTRSRYEGPTGMVGTLLTRFQAENIPYSSIWGVSPSYLSVSPNWKVAERLLGALNRIYNFSMDLSELSTLSLRFEAQVAEAVARQADIATFVQALEENYDRGFKDISGDDDEGDEGWGDGSHEEEGELPSADILIQELERQLCKQRENNNDRGSSNT